MKRITRWLPLALIIIAFILVIVFRLYEYISFSALKQHHELLKNWTNQYYWRVVAAFVLIYILAVAISIPGGAILTIIGGYLFGYVFGTIYVVVSATIGACLIFLAVKTALGDWIAGKARGWVKRMEQGFQQNAFSYLLFIRLVPIFPFWAVNIAPALLDVRLAVFALATLIGIIPGSFVYVSVGRGLGTLFAENKTPNLAIIFEPRILMPILALAILALIPIFYKKIKKRKDLKT